MAKSTLQAIAAVIADRYELKSSDATAFVAAFFDQIREGLAQDKQVKSARPWYIQASTGQSGERVSMSIRGNASSSTVTTRWHSRPTMR